MSKKKSWPDDPVVDEVRKIRQTIWKEAGGNIQGLLALLDREVPLRPSRKPRKRRRSN